MSLINEALKRARVEAARREAAEQGVLYPAVPNHIPVRRRSSSAMVLGIAVGLALALGLGGIAWYTAASRGEEEVAPGAGPTALEGAPSDVPAGTSAAGATGGIGESPSPPPRGGPESGSERPLEEIPEPEAPGAAAPAARPGAAEGHRSRQDGSASGPEGDSAVESSTAAMLEAREVKLEGGGHLALSGIAWSGNPYALINGRVVGAGETIEGFTVTKIEPRSVTLRRGEEVVRLRLGS